ncbi:unnamed protein product (macronuclear) [Paramecium tetraurelia]|uniref:Uncharacterized protein n=1 Tax=Paramecium tetraurelia TaxID=5888 RepID=A0E904_PARTE|nr:uncharacterized protein GSPATT00024502001 [Paramecium tetraurelia]CAK91771.1 unnamed protein product [Paramecium tetraurelia]|eukprot:XP_001459168.1 hypothetical protein (macronuclear) [Paramecium tetraurelia strain d4-2]
MSKEILPIIHFDKQTLTTKSKTQMSSQSRNLIYKTLYVPKDEKNTHVNSSIKTENESYDYVVNQLHQHKQLRLPPSRLINQLRRQKMNVDKIPRPKAKKLSKPSFSINLNTKDKHQLQKQICNYVQQANKLQQYKLSSIHSRRQDFKPYFNFDEFSFMDEIFPHSNLVKKKFGLNEQIMFRNSMGLEKVILQRIIQSQEDE